MEETNNLKTRKFIICLLCTMLTFISLQTSKIDGGQFVTLLSLIYATFVTGNVWEKKQ